MTPNLLAQFESRNLNTDLFFDMDDSLTMMFQDAAKIARGEITPNRVSSYAKETLIAVSLIRPPA